MTGFLTLHQHGRGGLQREAATSRGQRDVSAAAREQGFALPVVVTTRAWLAAGLADALALSGALACAAATARLATCDHALFSSSPHGASGGVQLAIRIGYDDVGEPTVTIDLPDAGAELRGM